ncbi:MAG: radical SAM protein, partial [Firmicutes bacterium]|nr:radical SAM protein [Bacillota bacterium]
MAICKVCFRHCDIKEGGMGFCGARTMRDGEVTAANYGRITSLALDPIEKKPLNHFFPGSKIISVGSYGCNLRCPFCQNSEISWGKGAFMLGDQAEYVAPEKLVAIAEAYRSRGNIGVAFTYNEPLVGYEYVRDAARLIHDKGMKNVVVTNG